MTTIAWPRAGKAGLTSANYQDQFASQTGIINDFTGDAFGAPTVSDVSNTVTLGAVGDLVSVAGFAAQCTVQPVMSAPAVGSPTTYWVYAEYDPALQAVDGSGVNLNPAGPVSVKIGTAAPSGAGKAWCLLYQFPRVASQLLSAAWALRTDFRRWIGPSLQGKTLVGATTGYGPFPRGATFYETSTGDEYVYAPNPTSLAWINRTRPAELTFPLNSPLQGVSGELAAVYTLSDSWVDAWGTVMRTSGGTLSTGSDVLIGTFPDGARPRNRHRFMLPGLTPSGMRAVQVYVQATGQTYMEDGSIPSGLTVSRLNLDGIRFRAEN